MKKKYFVTPSDKKDWIDFTKHIGDIKAKEVDLLERNTKQNRIPKLDLHGYSLSEANIILKKFIIESFNYGCRKILIITGKGSRSKSRENPYISEKLSVLKYSVPEYIKNNENLNRKIIKISNAGLKNRGDGSIYIFLKNNKKFKE